jgi:hypothetical protein
MSRTFPTEDELAVMALQAGMRPMEAIELLDTFARMRALAPILEQAFTNIMREGISHVSAGQVHRP